MNNEIKGTSITTIAGELDSAAGFKAEYFEDLYEIESSSFWFRGRNKLIIWALGKYFDKASSFLEVGCGTGFVLRGIDDASLGLKLAGSELFAEGLRFAKLRLPNTELLELDARKLPFEDAYDIIGAFDVLEHIDEDEVVLAELYKASRRGIILTVPQHRFLWSGIDELACHKRRYSARELAKKVEAAGFTIVRQTSFVSFLLPLMFLSRCRKKTAEQVDQSEFQLPRLLDRLLECTIDFEKTLISWGVNLPMGGSLLLVAHKVSR